MRTGYQRLPSTARRHQPAAGADGTPSPATRDVAREVRQALVTVVSRDIERLERDQLDQVMIERRTDSARWATRAGFGLRASYGERP